VTRSKIQKIILIAVGVLSLALVLIGSSLVIHYLTSQKSELFQAQTGVIHDNLNKVSNRVNINATSLGSILTIMPKVDQEQFAKLVDKVIAHEPYLESLVYYKKIDHAERKSCEDVYPEGILATSSTDPDEVIASTKADYYLVSHAANSSHVENIYLGWDLLSDKSIGNPAREAIKTNKIIVTSPYLLDEGDSAVEVLIPIESENEVTGILSMTLNISMFLGQKSLRQGFKTSVWVPLRGTLDLKNVLTSNMTTSSELFYCITMLNRITSIDLFGNQLEFRFEQPVYLGDFNSSILISCLLLGLSMIIFSLYLSITLEKLFNTEQSRRHSYKQLQKVFYPHQLTAMERGSELEMTMPVGGEETCVISFDIAGSSKIRAGGVKEFLRDFFSTCNNLMIKDYQENNNVTEVVSNAFRIKEMGDGLICSVGFPYKSISNDPFMDALTMAEQFIASFKQKVDEFDYPGDIFCGCGIAHGAIETFFPKSSPVEYDMYGRGIVLACRYEAMRKIVLKNRNLKGNILILAETVFNSIDNESRKNFERFDFKENNCSVRDDAEAECLYYKIT